MKPLKITLKTPIEEIQRLRSTAKIYIKRDDLNGLLISGNKARKLEYLIADAKNRNCDTIITCGPVQSNHCRTTVVFAQHFGLECHLLLRLHGKQRKIYTGNLLIDRLLGAKVHYITPAQYDRRNEIMKAYANGLSKKGKKPYIIPEGGSNEIGALGYIDCMKEMKNFIKEEKIEAVYCAVGSGGTYSGLLLGKKILNLNIDLNGIIICDTIEFFKEKIYKICETAIDKFTMGIEIGEDDINLIDGYVGEGYGIPYPAELKTISRLAKLGIILEPVYTGKAFYGMLNHVRKSKYKKVIFIHTGGIFSIFAFAKDITSAITRTKGVGGKELRE